MDATHDVHVQPALVSVQQASDHNKTRDGRIAMDKDAWALLDYWFSLPSEAWFKPSAAVDEHLRLHFGHLVDKALAGRLDHWKSSPRGTLALILVLDQLTRNIFRNQAKAFAGDLQAQAIADEGVKRGDDTSLALIERIFFTLPWEHAENLQLQMRMVDYTKSLEKAASPDQKKNFMLYRVFAERHLEVIQKFGRFPHRNLALGRDSTPAEQEYLNKPGSGF